MPGINIIQLFPLVLCGGNISPEDISGGLCRNKHDSGCVAVLGKLSLKSGRGEDCFTFTTGIMSIIRSAELAQWSHIIIRQIGEEESDIFCSS